MPHEVIRYACDHCGRTYLSKNSTKRHEKKCFYDPENNACVTCAHLVASADDKFALEFGEAVFKGTHWEVDCDIQKNLEDTGMMNGSVEKTYRVHCPFWEKRSAVGTYKFGKTLLEKV